MSISGSTPFYLLVHKPSSEGLFYALFNPHGWRPDELIKKGEAVSNLLASRRAMGNTSMPMYTLASA